MNILLWVHVAGGIAALLAGSLAAAAGKGGTVHVRFGTWFFGSMLILGASAAILAWVKEDPDPGHGGLLTCYFVATGWTAARRRDGRTGRFEVVACALVLAAAAMILWSAFAGAATTPAGRAPLIASAAVCLLAGLLDLNAILRRKLTPTQRISRHVWRTCVAFFLATGSFFIGQQDVLPAAVRGSPLLLTLGFAPLALLAFWLIRIRFGRSGPRSWLVFLTSRQPRPSS